ncbi:MAG: outer-membrane lipoprotein carrier protein LolA [Holophagaceae bacterium]|jgi:outer membrane lipoprotein-sorting protein
MRTSVLLVIISGLVIQTTEQTFEKKLKASLINMEYLFSQSSSSPIFGEAKEKGQIFVGEKGQFRMDYDSGVSIVSDGRTIVQYDPSTNTATRSLISAEVRTHSLWDIICNQESNATTQVTKINSNAYAIRGLGITSNNMPIEFRFNDSYLESIQWVDKSGGTQILSLGKPKALRFENRKRLILTLPNKTRWVK